jgi:hypothetical protein
LNSITSTVAAHTSSIAEINNTFGDIQTTFSNFDSSVKLQKSNTESITTLKKQHEYLLHQVDELTRQNKRLLNQQLELRGLLSRIIESQTPKPPQLQPDTAMQTFPSLQPLQVVPFLQSQPEPLTSRNPFTTQPTSHLPKRKTRSQSRVTQDSSME